MESKVQLPIQELQTQVKSVHVYPSVPRSQPTGEMHSQSLRLQGSPLVPPSLGGATLGPSSPAKVHHLFLGQDSLVQAPVPKKPAYSPLSHSPSLNLSMKNGMSCSLPGCGYSTTSQIPAEVEHYLHLQLLDYHFKT